MKADWNDAPEYIRRYSRKRGAFAWVIPGVIGTIITLGLLQMAGSAFLKGTMQSLAEKNVQPKSAPVAVIGRAEPAATKDWDKVVEQVAAKGAIPQPNSAQLGAGTAGTPPNKQSVFTDANYMPRGADNVVRFQEPPQPVIISKPIANKKVTVVGDKPSRKDRACWPYKAGSIERRNCRSSIGLNYRD